MALLEIEDVSVQFGGHVALQRVHLAVEEATVTGLIGPNGAGKTTLFNVVNGLLEPSAGAVHFDGRPIDGMAPYRRARVGMARTFQRLELFTSLSVRGNVEVAGEMRNRWSIRSVARMNVRDEADRVLALVGLSDVADREVGEIPTGQARLVELARALMTRPRLLLLDEPASGQDEYETVAFGALLRRLVDDGITVFLVEHDMSLVMSVCDTINVLDFGTVIAQGPPAAIQADAAVLAAYLGADS